MEPVSSSSRYHYRHQSFSSTLLDQIYRSIDDSPALDSTKKKKKKKNNKQQRYTSLHENREASPDNLVFHRRSIAADFDRSSRTTATSFSDSRVFSSSESDSFYRNSRSSASSPPPPKPIRTSAEKSTGKQDLGGFLRTIVKTLGQQTKSKALKIYADLKKAKQPISPGGRLATFLNSLFTNAASNNKKPKKITTVATEPPSTVSSATTTSCSSASSLSRSCLSKTPSSSEKSKRSVRFCPVNVILDEDSYNNKPYGNNNKDNDKSDRHVMEEENRRVIEAAKDLIRTYHNKNKDDMTNVDDDDDAMSCAISDLFELENLSAIGIESYRQELPVYETTRLDNTNLAIATI
ncbi:unnamed protein product [Cochlearia groenlandica]